MKMRALLRYRQLQFQFKGSLEDWKLAFAKVKVAVMPILEHPDGSFHNDSTPLIYDLEQRHNERSVVPSHEADAFLAFLIEDMADEWLSKTMYAYRWAYPDHTLWTGRLIAFDQNFAGQMGEEKITKFGAGFERRQVGRNALVGCSQENMPMIEHISERWLDIMEGHVINQPFLFGSRPSIADFGIYGQMSQFIVDLAAIEPCQKRAPYTMRWLHHMDDLSGYCGDWRAHNQPHHPAIDGLLAMAGEQYLPFLLANAEAISTGADRVEISACDFDYQQSPFKYQLKCLQQLRAAYAGLSQAAREELNPLLEKHGCLAALNAV